MKHTYFLTGYPGFLASSLITQLIKDHKKDIEKIHLLVLPSLKDKAVKEITSLTERNELNPDFFNIIPGDITVPSMKIDAAMNNTLKSSVTHVFHLAAIYDLAVPKDIAFRVNVNGTKNVNDWVKTLDRLKRYIYFSTAYVSGTREGRIFEHELVEGQTFRNHYERTKFEAELMVEGLKASVPTTIIRPGIVRGHSKTGETIKFDGIYFMLNLLDHLRFLPVIPYFSEGSAEGNFVPSDYVLEATSFLSFSASSVGKTYHLTDPNPYTMRELHTMLSQNYVGKTPKGTIPLPLAKSALSSAPVRKWLYVEKEAMDYFMFQSSYDSTQTIADLAGSGIRCPDFKETIDSMIIFYRKYRHDKSRHIQIV
ncbi:3-beta hydroxysteroid dehydrogenase [Virgibacillus profundi]|uniref:3-beta hydroxysteroid dehydrogenase n=1 Tax=Virgibacillus profundi TaxID=2024555 RepID=A0A2A2IEM4_9BACI|nr:SDR family oxidoreductase [Virgibacillus profundi]PAV29766.1 3-beta hydroxysteroid dehydrogenase [Virgibacillus profundi]PXY53938.1 3-beta hydroxysteroid dehydrogenase [Virgibacillus profundi]